MKKQTITFTLISILLVAVLSACSGKAVAMPQQVNSLLNGVDNLVVNDLTAQATPAPDTALGASAPPIQSSSLAAYQGALEDIYTNVSPSVVNISVRKEVTAIMPGMEGFPEMPFDIPGLPEMPDQPNQEPNGSDPHAPEGSKPQAPEGRMPQGPQYDYGMGSGFVWDQKGHIITNNHVVAGAEEIDVTFADGTTVEAQLVGADPHSDLAVVKVELPANQLKPVQLADSNQVNVGQLAIAIGNPFGLEGTMTIGIVSGLGRSIPAAETNFGGPAFTIPNIIQTDAPINPGNSGGVLLDSQGQVIGVPAAIESPVGVNAGIGFAIPSSIVQRIAPALIENGSYEHSFLGISGNSLSPDVAEAMGLKASQRGALVGEVVPGGPAEAAGLRGSDEQVTLDGFDALVGGDVITAIDGSPIRGMDELIAYLSSNTEVGQTVEMTILRDGKETTVEVTLQARPEQVREQKPAEKAKAGGAWLGIRAQTLSPEMAAEMELSPDQRGVLVQQVQDGSPANDAGLRGSEQQVTIEGQEAFVGGDVIIALNDEEVSTMRGLLEQLSQAEAGETISITILRDGEQIELSVTLGQRPAEGS